MNRSSPLPPGPDPLAARLYDAARTLPVIDFHNHLDPLAVADDRRFTDLTALWLDADPYKHRAMRMAGVDERLITGDAPPRDKLRAWAATLPTTLGTPLYEWSAMELSRFFGVDAPLTEHAADALADRLQSHPLSTRDILRRCHVERLCTSDRLLDDLGRHPRPLVNPSLRADDVLALDPAWIDQLAAATGHALATLDDYLDAVDAQLDRFAAHGCRIVDHAIDDFSFTTPDAPRAARAFRHRRAAPPAAAAALDRDDADAPALRSFLLHELCRRYARRGWTLLLHLGALRHTSSRLRRLAGPAGGFASIGYRTHFPQLAALLDALEQHDALPRTILFPLDPHDYPAAATLGGSFVKAGSPGHVQLGPAWWYNDHAGGIRAQLDATLRYGLLATAVGFTTDSRSFLSLVRHDYFRRVLCRWLADRAADGELPADEATLLPLVRKLCHENARDFLLPSPP